ncbi:hypothetical protein CY35_19G005300 [Sphagnum magellanicum]|nr:hypothetical protein CY35_19G005300 [Sphagnum magellanicum]
MAEVGSPGSQDSPHSDDYGNNQGGGDRNNSSVREQDRFLPIANISRIMKKALPANAKIAKDAKETIQECVSEFISFITSEASDKCQREKRKTINGDDLLWAMSTLGFEEYVEPLKVYLHKYRETFEFVLPGTYSTSFGRVLPGWTLCFFQTEGEKGAVINKSSGEAASGKKEGSGMMSPGVQMVGPVTYQAPHY